MKFSINGPDIPEALIEESLSGKVIFLCGAGVSKTAGLPLFSELVEMFTSV